MRKQKNTKAEPRRSRAKNTRQVFTADEIAALKHEVCDWLASGRALAEYCDQPGKPHRQRVYEWRDADPVFMSAFVKAQDCGIDEMDDRMRKIAADQTRDPQCRRTELWFHMQLRDRWRPPKLQHQHTGKVTLEQLIEGANELERQERDGEAGDAPGSLVPT